MTWPRKKENRRRPRCAGVPSLISVNGPSAGANCTLYKARGQAASGLERGEEPKNQQQRFASGLLTRITTTARRLSATPGTSLGRGPGFSERSRISEGLEDIGALAGSQHLENLAALAGSRSAWRIRVLA